MCLSARAEGENAGEFRFNRIREIGDVIGKIKKSAGSVTASQRGTQLLVNRSFWWFWLDRDGDGVMVDGW